MEVLVGGPASVSGAACGPFRSLASAFSAGGSYGGSLCGTNGGIVAIRAASTSMALAAVLAADTSDLADGTRALGS